MDDGRYDDAIKYCNELIVVDFTNSRRWSARIAEINSKKERAAEEQKRWNELIREIESAHLAEDWKKLNSLCKKALDIRENKDIRSKFEKSEDKLAEIRKNEQFVKTMSEINELVVRKEFDEANNKLNNLERSLRREGLLDAAKEAQIRDKRKSLFDFGQNNSDGSSKNDVSEGSNERTRIKGFTTDDNPKPQNKEPKKKSGADSDFDWDFGSPQKKKQPVSRPQQAAKKKSSKSDDDFFGSDTSNKSLAKSSSSKPNGKITNEDFDF